MPNNITAILTGYNRPMTMNALADAVRGQSIPPDDVWVWYNKGTEEQEEIEDVKAAYCNANFGFFSRFAMALLAPTPYVALFDDDTIPGERWFENCLETMEKTPGILGTVGIYLNGPYYRGHERVGWPAPNEITATVDLIGHCWFMRKEDLKWMFMEEPFRTCNGEDIHLAALAWRYGGVQCYVPPHPPRDKSMWGSLHGQKLGMDKAASSLQSIQQHIGQRDAIVKEEIDRGWKPLHRREGEYADKNVVPLRQSSV